MCRLYGFKANKPSQLDCDLIEAQNSLVRQSAEDGRGLTSPDGWGMGLLREGEVRCQREVSPAYESDVFRAGAGDACAETFVAHVRRATVGRPAPENTHPFCRDGSLFVHNGHIDHFDELRPRLVEEMSTPLRERLSGTTDSEHFFHLVLSRWEQRGGTPDGPDARGMRRLLRETAEDVVRWHDALGSGAAGGEVSLNALWATGGSLAGIRLGRSLGYVERRGSHRCGACGEVHGTSDDEFRAVAVASERITDEDWKQVPPASAFHVTPHHRLEFAPLELPRTSAA